MVKNTMVKNNETYSDEKQLTFTVYLDIITADKTAIMSSRSVRKPKKEGLYSHDNSDK